MRKDDLKGGFGLAIKFQSKPQRATPGRGWGLPGAAGRGVCGYATKNEIGLLFDGTENVKIAYLPLVARINQCSFRVFVNVFIFQKVASAIGF